MADQSELESLYREAQAEIRSRKYDHAGELLKQILVIDENYKDASRLLAQTVKLKRRRWYNHPLLWGTVGLTLVIVIGIFFAPRLVELYTNQSASETATATPKNMPTPAKTLVPTPVSIPLAWKRISIGLEFPRDTITVIVVDPKDTDVMYVGTQNAGIFKSIDGGLSWQPIQNGLGRAPISRLVIDPVNSRTLYASTKGRLYKTTDGGANWQELAQASQSNGSNTFIVLDPQNSQILYYADEAEVHRSTDGGVNWETVKPEGDCPGQIYYHAFIGHITESGVLLASDWDEGGCQPGLYRSTDGGRTWDLIGLEGKKWIANIAVGLDWQGNEVLYATDSVSRNTALYTSRDGGKTWKTILDEGCPNNLLVDPDLPTTVYCGLYKSLDGGYSWEKTLTSPPHNITAMTIPDNGETILAGTDAGLFISSDGGASWDERNSGLAGTLIDLRVDPSDPSTFYANLLDGSQLGSSILYRSINGGQSWDLIERGRGLAIDEDGGIYRVDGTEFLYSQDGGKTWTSSLLPVADEDIIGLGTNPATPGTVFVVFPVQQMYFTTDYGKTWRESTVPEIENGLSEAKFFFDPNQGQKGYMVPSFYAFQTSDAGITWEECDRVESTPPTRSIMTIDPRDSNRIVLAVLGKGLFLSRNGCQSWQSSNTGLGSLFVNSLAIDPNNPDTLYAGTDDGAYISTDGGETWSEINDGLLGATVVYSIVVDKDSSVYAATPYGIFKLESQ